MTGVISKSLLALAAASMIACSPAYEKTQKGVVVNVDGPNGKEKVRLEVVNDKVVHVSATVADKFSAAKSLIAVEQTGNADFSVSETDSSVVLSTAALKVSVSKASGEVNFMDAAGNPILSEEKGGGRTFEPIEVEGTKAYTVRQVFESADDEAFYGLGQHQADEFNYKGKNEELFQYNTKVSVPFIVSNKGYGVLWDSYSLCRFGNPNDYSQLGKVFKLYDKEGAEGALTGTYVPAKGSDAETIVRREDSIYFEYLDDSKRLSKVVNTPDGFPFMDSKVTYEGEIEPAEDGTFRFILYYAGYMSVTIDGKAVVPERWRTAWNPNSYKFSVDLEAGKRVPIRIDWVPDGGVSYCGLRVLSPVPEAEQNKMSWWGEMQNQIDYYFMYGQNIDEVISGYRTVTGKAQIMPKWAMGYWQSRERYKTQDEIVSTLREFRQRRIPIDNIVMDWSHWAEDQWGGHEFDPARFQDPKGMVDSIHAMHGRMMVSVWPKFYVNTDHYKEFDAKGWMYPASVQDSIRDWIGQGYMYGFYDAYNADARDLFWKQMYEHYYPLGIDAWWMDASEPNIRDCTSRSYMKKLCGPTALGPSTQYLNAYALMNADAIYNGQRSVDNNKRVFLLTRSGFAGLQRYSTATWSGDIATRWEDMKAQISAGLNFAVSGIPYWTMDIGGFCVETRYVAGQEEYNKTGKENADYKEWRELNTRWYQFGAFCPLYRAHGQYPFREAWNIAPEGHPCFNSIVYYTKLRYNLMPYIYSMAGMTHFSDYTIMRPLVMDYTKDAKVNNISDQFMFGPAMMVCPVCTYGARSREVYFPETTGWYDFYTGKYIRGGQQLSVEAPYERIPLYVREGAILPVGEDMQYTDEKPADNITIYVYAGQNGSFTLYEDEGVNYNYEQGKYSTIELTYDDANSTLVIGERKGEYEGMLQQRTFNVVLVKKDAPVAYNATAAKGVAVTYNGEQQAVKL